nr:immunoglobulin light chain junction region [Macaca mulatta]
CQQYNGLPLSF